MTIARSQYALVLGATGLVGQGLRAEWRGAGPAGLCPVWQTRAAARLPGADWLRWSPLDAAPPALPDLGVVLVLAGVTPTTGQGVLDDNARLALAGLEAGVRNGARHVFLFSSQAVYAPGARPEDEQTPPAPPNAYGEAKLEMERQAALWRDAAGPEAPGVTCLRLGNVAGTDMLGRSVASRNPLVLDRFADGHGPRRSYIGIGGLARVLGTLMARAMAGEALPFVLNVAAPRPVAMSDLLTAWGRAWTWRPAPPAALQTVTMDTGRLAALHVFTEADSDPAAMAAEWTEATL